MNGRYFSFITTPERLDIVVCYWADAGWKLSCITKLSKMKLLVMMEKPE